MFLYSLQNAIQIFRYHFGLEWEKRKIVRRVHAKRILQTALHIKQRKKSKLSFHYTCVITRVTSGGAHLRC